MSFDDLFPEARTYAKFVVLYKPLAVLAAAVFAAMYFVTALPRVFYPYDLDFIEDSMLMQALRFAQGQPVFAPPSADFAAHAYTPLYPWLGGLLFKLVAPSFVPLRLLSLAATLATAAILFYVARRESGQTWLGVVCAGLYLGGYRLSGFWYELARVDSLYVTLALAGVALGVYARSIGWATAALALALFTKQTGVAFAVWFFLHLLFIQGRQAWRFVPAYLALAVVPLILLDVASGGWFGFYAFGVASGNPVEWERVAYYIFAELFGVMAGLSLMMIVAGILVLRRAGWQAIRSQPWLAAVAVAVLISGVGRASVGGNLNNLMIGYAFLCLAPALLWKEMNREDAKPAKEGKKIFAIFAPSRLIPAAVIIQFALGVYNPLRYIPTAEMRQSGDRLVARIGAIDGEVLVMMHPYYALLAGKEPAAQAALIWHAHVRQAQPLPQDFVARIESQYYAAIISDETLFETDAEIRELLAAHYTPTGILDTSESPPTLSGMFARPTVIYTPKAQPAGGG
jgi:hypothetical protein